jgi:hypothetical protein
MLAVDPAGERRGSLSPKGQCASMCPFVLLGGVLRHVPEGATIMVHQPWPLKERDDPMAKTYSAQEWVMLQRQLGEFARYTIEMGGDIALYETSLRIPPWEVLRPLTRAEIRRVGLSNTDNVFDKTAVQAAALKPGPQVAAPLIGAAEAEPAMGASEWGIVQRAGVRLLTRAFPLTVQGESIGRFEISLGCGFAGKNYKVAYVETRRLVEGTADRLVRVGLGVAGLKKGEAQGAPLAVESSRKARGVEVESIARGTVSAAFVNAMMRDGGQPMAVATITTSKLRTTAIVGKTGLADSFEELAASCKR